MRDRSSLDGRGQVTFRIALFSLGLAAGLAVLSWLVGEDSSSVLAYLVVLSIWAAILATLVWLGGRFLGWFRRF